MATSNCVFWYDKRLAWTSLSLTHNLSDTTKCVTSLVRPMRLHFRKEDLMSQLLCNVLSPLKVPLKDKAAKGALPSEQGLEAALNRAETQSEKPNVGKCLRTNFWHSLRSIVK